MGFGHSWCVGLAAYPMMYGTAELAEPERHESMSQRATPETPTSPISRSSILSVLTAALLLMATFATASSANAQPDPVVEPDPVLEPDPVVELDPVIEPDPISQPELAVLTGDPILPPAEIEIERVLYATAFEANPEFDCTAPSTRVVERLEDAGWVCYTITNTGPDAVAKFTLSDADMRPAHTYMPPDFDDDWFEPGLVIVHQVEVSTGNTAFGSQIPFFGDNDDYEIALYELYQMGIADVLIDETRYAEWGLYSLPLRVDESSPVTFVEQRNKWDTLGIDDYEMIYDPVCFCGWMPDAPPPFRVRVIDGVIESAVSIETGQPAPPWSAMTVDEMMERIASATDPASPAWQVNGTMDVLYGLPTTWFIDESLLIADEEFGVFVRDFAPLRSCADGYVRFPADCELAFAADGDVNCSGETDIVDALLVALHDAELIVDDATCPWTPGLGLDGIYAARGDVNEDGATNIVDALVIARCSVGLPTGYCDAMGLVP